MNNPEAIIAEISQKIKRLGENKRELTERLQKSERESEVLKEKIISLEMDLGKLKEENHVLMMAKTLDAPHNEGSTEARKRINELVKEIDKCISLLNK
jgi:hypothetical protein